MAVKKEAVKKVASSHLPSEADQAAFLDDSAAADTGSAAGKAPAPANPATDRVTRSKKRAADIGQGNATKCTKATKAEATAGEDEDEDEGDRERTSDDFYDRIAR